MFSNLERTQTLTWCTPHILWCWRGGTDKTCTNRRNFCFIMAPLLSQLRPVTLRVEAQPQFQSIPPQPERTLQGHLQEKERATRRALFQVREETQKRQMSALPPQQLLLWGSYSFWGKEDTRTDLDTCFRSQGATAVSQVLPEPAETEHWAWSLGAAERQKKAGW